AILSYGAWQRRFGGRRQIIGQSMTINGEPFTIVGVMPANFTPYPDRSTEIWAVPAFVLSKLSRGHHGLFTIARLRHGIPVSQAQSEMDTIARRLAKDYPNTNATSGVLLVTLVDEVVGGSRAMLVLLAVLVGILLVITCANLASLLLGRIISRQQEVAIRLALGASRQQLARQVITESLLIAITGGLCGLLLAYWAVPALVATFGRFIPRSQTITVNSSVLLFCALTTILCGIAFGLAPAFTGASSALYSVASNRFAVVTKGSGRFPLRRSLVTLEVGLALVLMIAAGVLFKSMWLLYRVNPGFDPEQVFTFRIQAPAAQYASDSQRVQFFEALLDRLTTLHGVRSAASVSDLPFSGSRSSGSFEIANLTSNGPGMFADHRTVSPDYFRTMGIPLLSGREFTTADNAENAPVAIVNASLIHKYLPERNPLEQQLVYDHKKYRIVGVIGDVKHEDLTAADIPELYIPLGQAESPPWTFITVKYDGSAATMSNEIRRAVAQVAAQQQIYSVRTMDERLSTWFAPRRFSATILGLFTGLALMLAAVGIYGVISYFVAQRTREFGVRMALGASARDVLGLVLRQAAALTAAAVAGGLAASFVTNRLLSSMLFGVTKADPFAIFVAVLALAMVALAAAYLPARRAMNVDPIVALRYE
ncbi:MAG: ABC transporter permease, partial [Acidobacteria bacterium]|nr:ABC transporter permease [Acidobacteriota bacterium]